MYSVENMPSLSILINSFKSDKIHLRIMSWNEMICRVTFVVHDNVDATLY